MLGRTLLVLMILVVVVFEAAVLAVMKDNAKGDKHLFQRWLVNWAIINTIIVLVVYYIATGTVGFYDAN